MSPTPTASTCPGTFPDMGASPNYRYFNQPIEQIPGWDATKSQILFHGANKGLWWQTGPECIDVVTCVRLTENGLEFDRVKVFVFKSANPDTECDTIPIISCEPSPPPSP